MSNDSVTETTTTGWLSRIGGALVAGLFGIVFFVVAFPLLAWNEGRAIKTAKTLQQGSKEVISAEAGTVDPANDGKLVHISGTATTPATLNDKSFGISVPAIKLRRDVEMYQWSEEKKSETKKNLGGSEETVTTYSYDKKWSSSLIDSSNFHKQDGHQNPAEMPVKERTVVARSVTVGAFDLSDSLVEKIDNYQPLSLDKDAASNVSAELPGKVQVNDDKFYVGQDPESPAVGDLKIDFETVQSGPVSIVARQIDHTFEPYNVKNLGTIELLQTGILSAQNMFESEEQGNVIMTWILRLVGFLLMFFGILLICNPIAVITDVIPFFGSLLEGGFMLVALAISVPLSLFTIALAWLAFRPLLGIPLFVLAVGCAIFGIRALWRAKKSKKAVAA